MLSPAKRYSSFLLSWGSEEKFIPLAGDRIEIKVGEDSKISV